MSTATVILAAALLLAMVINLALKPKNSAKINTAFMLIAVFGGLLYYGIGHFQATGDLLLATIRTPISVLRMFVGVNEYSAIQGTALVSTHAGVLVFWILHLMAFYSLASAALMALGGILLRYLRLAFARRGDLALIYGVDDASIALGSECRASGLAVVLVDEDIAPAVASDINDKGMAAVSGLAAANSEASFLKRLRLGKRKVTVFALKPQLDDDLRYAQALKAGMEALGVDPRTTRIVLPGSEESVSPLLEATQDCYGFGYVNVYDEAELAARALLHVVPPWDLVSFDERGRAQGDLRCAILGFGEYGQAALRYLAMNGQFAGSQFHAFIVDPHFADASAFIKADCPELFNRFDIRGVEGDCLGSEFMAHFEEHRLDLNLVVVATEDGRTDQRIADRLMGHARRCGADGVKIVRCGPAGVFYQEHQGAPLVHQQTRSLDYLEAERLDRRAIAANATYDASSMSPWDKWIACGSFSRMSSRATADFAPALLKMSGIDEASALMGGFAPRGVLLENLAETEHMRWCAFHYAFGWSPMDEETLRQRGAEYVERQRAGLPADVRITKDVARRLHACLVPWDELDRLSQLERQLTGRQVDYKQLDRNNVLAVPDLLRCADERRLLP